MLRTISTMRARSHDIHHHDKRRKPQQKRRSVPLNDTHDRHYLSPTDIQNVVHNYSTVKSNLSAELFMRNESQTSLVSEHSSESIQSTNQSQSSSSQSLNPNYATEENNQLIYRQLQNQHPVVQQKQQVSHKHVAVAFDGSLESLSAVNYAFTNSLENGDCLTIITSLPGYYKNDHIDFEQIEEFMRKQDASDDKSNHNSIKKKEGDNKKKCKLSVLDLVKGKHSQSGIDRKRCAETVLIDVSSPGKIKKAREVATEIRMYLAALKSSTREKVNITIKIMWGNTVSNILKTCTKENFEYLLLGTAGHASYKNLFFGSVGYILRQKSKIPVITYRRHQ